MSENSNFIEMYGVATKIIGGQYTITLTNDLKISGYVAGKMRHFNIRVYEKDLVKVHLSPYDLEQGRIIYRLNPKKEQVPSELKELCNRLNITLPKTELLGEESESKSFNKRNK